MSGELKFTRIFTGDGFRDVEETPAEVTRAFDAAMADAPPPMINVMAPRPARLPRRLRGT